MDSLNHESLLKEKFLEFYFFSIKEAKKKNLSISDKNYIIERVINELAEKAVENIKETDSKVDELELLKKKNELLAMLLKYKNEIEMEK